MGAAAPPPPNAGAALLWGCPPTRPHKPGGTPAPERLGGGRRGGEGGEEELSGVGGTDGTWGRLTGLWGWALTGAEGLTA